MSAPQAPEVKHTPLPWEIGDLDPNGQRIVRNEQIEICTCWHHSVGSIEKEMEANAEFIVRACNSHYKLLEALKAADQLILSIAPVFHDKRIADYISSESAEMVKEWQRSSVAMEAIREAEASR